MAEIKLTDAQKARIERNRQRALMLRNARLSSRPYPEIRPHDQESTRTSQVSTSNATTAHAIDTGGGFLLDPDDEETLDTAQKNIVEDPGKCISLLCAVVGQMQTAYMIQCTCRLASELIDATFEVAKRKPEKKFRLVRDSNP